MWLTATPVRAALALACLWGAPPARALAQVPVDRAAYARAERMLPWNRDRVLFNAEVDTHWIDGTEALWYQSRSEAGWRFVVADAASRTRRPAFDHARMAEALRRVTAAAADSSHLPISQLEFRAGPAATPRVTVRGASYDCDLAKPACVDASVPRRKLDQTWSPDGRYAVFAKGPDLWVLDQTTGRERALTTDGEPTRAYGAVPSFVGPVLRQRAGTVYPPTGNFSPDGSKFLTYRLDETRSPELSLIQYLPDDGSIRPKVWSYRIPLPGDPPASARLVLFDLATGARVDVDHPPSMIEFRTPLPFRQIEWSADGRSCYFVDFTEDLREGSLFRTDLATGRTIRLITERSDANLVSYFTPRFALLGNGDIIWPSQRTGWQQLYYYDAEGALKATLTEGESVVRELIRADPKSRTVIFSAGGRDPNLDPYLRQLYEVGFDGRGLRLLAAEPADHQVKVGGRQFLGVNQADVASGFSGSGRYFVDGYSRVDLPTATVVRDRAGRAVMTLETAHLDSAFARLYSPPETFRALGSDGITPVWGILIKPSNFDPARRYPVVDAVYGGPQTPYVPKRYGGDLNGLYGRSFAELGAIAVVVDGRNTPQRSKAFFDAGYGHLGKSGFLEDHVSAIRELARSRGYLDSSRVGIYGFSGGGYAVIRAMFDYPDFFSVGIEASLYDPMLNDWSWGQKYQGPYDSAGYARQAPSYNVANFKGKLFMAIGDLDDVVHPSATMRVVDQLVKHDKDFDLLVVPNQDHGLLAQPYLIRRQWDYFVTHLLGGRPPAPYAIAPPLG